MPHAKLFLILGLIVGCSSVQKNESKKLYYNDDGTLSRLEDKGYWATLEYDELNRLIAVEGNIGLNFRIFKRDSKFQKPTFLRYDKSYLKVNYRSNGKIESVEYFQPYCSQVDELPEQGCLEDR